MKQIVVRICADGTMTAATKGIKGPACLAEVATIEALCGEQITSSNLTSEFYEEASSEHHARESEIRRITDDDSR